MYVRFTWEQESRHPVIGAGTPRIHTAVLVPEKKNVKLCVALATFWRILYIFRSLDVRAYVGHREALVLFT
jgi:hypothetical protein